MKKLLMIATFVIMAGTAFAKTDSIYNFKALEKNMEKTGYALDYVKKDVGFNFKKESSHVEVVGYKTYAETSESLSKMFNVIYQRNLTMIPSESDIGNGIYVFSHPEAPNKALVVVADFEHHVVMNAFGTKDELETSIKFLKDAQVKK